MITEDYVSYEIAKLLGEKGFDELSTVFYNEDGTDLIELYDYEPLRNSEILGYARVTQSLALKWLREVHNIEIAISYGIVFDSNTVKQVFRYFWSIVKVNGLCLEYPMNNPDDACYKEIEANSYEEAIEAALLYVLKNLI